MPDWMSGWNMVWIGSAWLVIVAGVCVAVPLLLVRLPPDYFADKKRPPDQASIGWRIARNVIGVVLLIVGLGLVVLPGPGLLCVLVGVMLVDFPGKHRVERAILSRKPVLAAANWVREKAGKQPLTIPT